MLKGWISSVTSKISRALGNFSLIIVFNFLNSPSESFLLINLHYKVNILIVLSNWFKMIKLFNLMFNRSKSFTWINIIFVFQKISENKCPLKCNGQIEIDLIINGCKLIHRWCSWCRICKWGRYQHLVWNRAHWGGGASRTSPRYWP